MILDYALLNSEHATIATIISAWHHFVCLCLVRLLMMMMKVLIDDVFPKMKDFLVVAVVVVSDFGRHIEIGNLLAIDQ